MKIEVGKKCATLIQDDTLIENSEKLYIVEFAFDESWSGFNKMAIFEAGGVFHPPVALTDDRCIIPAECLKKAGVMLRIGVSGEKDEETKPTVWCLGSRILYRAKLDKITSGVSGDVSAQVIEIIRSMTATDEEVQEAINDAFDSSSPGGSGEESPDNTATDEEVENMIEDVFG